MQAKESSHATKIDKKEGRNSTYANRKNNQSNLKNSSKRSIIRSRFSNQTTKKAELLEKSQRAIEKWFVERLWYVLK